MSANKQLLLLGNVASGTYEPNAVKFDGTNDYLTRGADLTGIADSKSGIFSCWIRVDNPQTSSHQYIFENLMSTNSFSLVKSLNGGVLLMADNAAATNILSISSSVTSVTGSAKFYHILISWDLAASASHIYISDVADQTVTTRTNDTIDYAQASANWAVGARTDGSNKFDGAISDLYFAPGQYLDFSTESNRRKFIDASGLPVSLGADGSTPTGTAPAIYLKGDYTGFGTNSGSGGNFTVNGALEKASSTPATAAVNAVDFDGSADYLTRGADLTGLIDGKSGILSCWLRRDGGDGTAQRILANLAGTLRFHLTKDASNKYVVTGINSAGSTILTLTSNTAYTSSPDWVHLLSSWDLAATTGTLYVDSASDLAGGSTLTNDTIDYVTATPNWSVGADTDATDKMFGAISELYFAPNQYLDLSVQANREKFILNGAPVSLGSDGSLPTGTAPAIYLPNRAALVGTNAGSGGNFTINGAPKDANSTPVYYYAEPSKFDGTNDYLTRGADLTGIADGKAGTISCWVRKDGGDGGTRIIASSGSNGKIQFYIDSGNKVVIQGLNSASAIILTLTSTGTYTTSAVWFHVVASWDLAAGVGRLYINNVDVLAGGATLTNDTIDYASAADFFVGAGSAGFGKFNGAIADLWFNTTYLDISQSANRAKFIDQSTLRPVPLGAKGELPTGSQPLLYLGRDYANFQTNLGSGGNFTVTGALERATTSPSDVRA